MAPLPDPSESLSGHVRSMAYLGIHGNAGERRAEREGLKRRADIASHRERLRAEREEREHRPHLVGYGSIVYGVSPSTCRDPSLSRLVITLSCHFLSFLVKP